MLYDDAAMPDAKDPVERLSSQLAPEQATRGLWIVEKIGAGTCS